MNGWMKKDEMSPSEESRKSNCRKSKSSRWALTTVKGGASTAKALNMNVNFREQLAHAKRKKMLKDYCGIRWNKKHFSKRESD